MLVDSDCLWVIYRLSFIVFVSKLVLLFKFWVFSLSKIALPGPLFRFTVVPVVGFQAATFCSSGRMERICPWMKNVPNSTLIATFTTTVNSLAVSKSPIWICSTMLPFFKSVLWRWESDGWLPQIFQITSQRAKHLLKKDPARLLCQGNRLQGAW